MQSLRELYKFGVGPSSSHTLAPQRACKLFLESYPDVDKVEVGLYGSLSLTGKGHHTDQIIIDTFAPIEVNVSFKLDWDYGFENGLIIKGYKNNEKLDEWVVFSIGGGSIEILNHPLSFNDEVYHEKDFNEIKEFMLNNKFDLLDYVLHYEKDILEYLEIIADKMIASVDNGISKEGLLPGTLKIKKSSKKLYHKALESNDNKLKLMAYAYAASEENASYGEVVTAPTLGSCGVVASTVYHLYKDLGYSKLDIAKGLAVGGIFGNIIKQNVTISGAVGGCQAEIGVACAMASAMLAYLKKANTSTIEYAAEMAIEHHLGLTCDPVEGYVIIPCIERNALAVIRAFDNCLLATSIYEIKHNVIDFDTVCNTMRFTGQSIPMELKETSLGGLAKEYKHV